MSYYTEEQALESIQKATNVDEIRKIIRQTDFVDHKAADNAISVFYQASMLICPRFHGQFKRLI